MVLYEIYREDGGNGITFVHMLYILFLPRVGFNVTKFYPERQRAAKADIKA